MLVFIIPGDLNLHPLLGLMQINHVWGEKARPTIKRIGQTTSIEEFKHTYKRTIYKYTEWYEEI